MRLLNLKLENFRNYPNFDLNFEQDKHITYIIGPNAHGKTNILEAIYLLALTKSFRTNNIQDMIMWERDYGRITGTFDLGSAYTPEADGTAEAANTMPPPVPGTSPGTESEVIELQAFIGNPPQPRKALKKNGVRTSAVNFIGNVQIVFFHPEDLNILYLGPDLRRKYLDILNIQVKPHYYAALRAYKRIMTQRNSLLKRIKEGYAKPDDLDIWDEQLAEQGSIIIKERVSSISFINERLTATYQNISKGDEKVHANYKSILTEGVKINPDTAPSNSLPNEQNSLSLGQIKDSFLNKLQTSRQRDLQAEFTTTGPHRDDIEFLLNDLPLIRHASRGEYRSLLMALKLVELSFYEQNSKQKPLLLLDDVFSELDPTRQKTLIDAIKDYQTILTSTHSPVDMTSYEKNVIILHDGITEPEKQIKK